MPDQTAEHDPYAAQEPITKPMRVELLTRQTCTCCRGVGKVDHPAWAKFWTHWLSNGNSTLISLEDGSHEQWFYDHGYQTIPELYLTCNACKGEGAVRGTLPLEDLLAALDRRKGMQP